MMAVEHFFGSGKTEPLKLQASGSTGVEAAGSVGGVGVNVGPFPGSFQCLSKGGRSRLIDENAVSGVDQLRDLLKPDVWGLLAIRIFKDAVEQVVGEGEWLFCREVQYGDADSVDEVFCQVIAKWLDLVGVTHYGDYLEVCGVGEVAEELSVGCSEDESVAFAIGQRGCCLGDMWVGWLCDVRWNFPLNVPWFPFIGSEAEEGTVVCTDKELSSYDGETVSISRNFLTPYDFPGIEGFGGDLAVSSEYAMGGRGNGGVGKLTSGGYGGVVCLSF